MINTIQLRFSNQSHSKLGIRNKTLNLHLMALHHRLELRKTVLPVECMRRLQLLIMPCHNDVSFPSKPRHESNNDRIEERHIAGCNKHMFRGSLLKPCV